MIRDFYIKKDSSLPLLVMKIVKDVHNDKIIDDIFTSVTKVTFSLKNDICDDFKIYNKKADLIVKEEDCVNCLEKKKQYYLVYKFNTKQTAVQGTFNGEFTISLDGIENYSSGIYKLPLKYDIKVNIV